MTIWQPQEPAYIRIFYHWMKYLFAVTKVIKNNYFKKFRNFQKIKNDFFHPEKEENVRRTVDVSDNKNIKGHKKI